MEQRPIYKWRLTLRHKGYRGRRKGWLLSISEGAYATIEAALAAGMQHVKAGTKLEVVYNDHTAKTYGAIVLDCYYPESFYQMEEEDGVPLAYHPNSK